LPQRAGRFLNVFQIVARCRCERREAMTAHAAKWRSDGRRYEKQKVEMLLNVPDSDLISEI
jgi:hypothetical protein